VRLEFWFVNRPLPLLIWLFALSIGAAGCSNPSAPAPPPPPPALPAMACPPDVRVSVVAVSSTVVEYAPPVATGGAPPVTTTCTIASGTTFPLGTSDVICTGTDSLSRSAQCVFRVTVDRTPVLKGTTILAFGDSITEGAVSPPAEPTVLEVDLLNNYPTLLQAALAERYTSQTITVINAGVGGESVTREGEDRLERLLSEHRPDVLILLEGVNDLNQNVDPDLVSEALRRSVRRARDEDVALVLVSTLLPGVEGRIKPPNPVLVQALNTEIRWWAGTEGVTLVDSYHVFNPMKELLIGVDGLHPTVDGYRKMAETFFEVLRSQFEESESSEAPKGLFRAHPWR
jgi:lysophospholipase L1-like esterase